MVHINFNPSLFTLYTAPPPFTLNPLLPAGKLESEFEAEEGLLVLFISTLIFHFSVINSCNFYCVFVSSPNLVFFIDDTIAWKTWHTVTFYQHTIYHILQKLGKLYALYNLLDRHYEG